MERNFVAMSPKHKRGVAGKGRQGQKVLLNVHDCRRRPCGGAHGTATRRDGGWSPPPRRSRRRPRKTIVFKSSIFRLRNMLVRNSVETRPKLGRDLAETRSRLGRDLALAFPHLSDTPPLSSGEFRRPTGKILFDERPRNCEKN